MQGSVAEPKVADLAENGREELGWRETGSGPALVVVQIGFSIAGLDEEAFEGFRLRMLRFAATLGKLGYPVAALIFQGRKAQNKRHWAEFTCETPETHLPLVVRAPRD